MKKILFLLCGLMMVCEPLAAKATTADCCGADAVCDGTRSATVLSMMGWGVGLTVGIALLTGLLDQEFAHGH